MSEANRDTPSEIPPELAAAMLRALATADAGLLSCSDATRRVLFTSRGASDGASPALGRRLEEFVSEAQRAAVVRAAEAALSAGRMERVECDAPLADGSLRALELSFVPFPGPAGERLLLQLTRDCTAQRRQTERWQQGEELRKGLIEHLPDYVVLVDREHRFRWVNRLAPGLSLEQVLGSPVEEFVSPETAAEVRRVVEHVFETGEPSHYEARAEGHGIEPHWYLTRVVPVREGDRVENVILLTSDISERKRVELALRASEARFRALAEHSPDFISVVDRRLVLEYINRTPPGQSNEDFVGKHLEQLVAPQDLALVVATVEEVLSTGRPAQYEAHAAEGRGLYRCRVAPFEAEQGSQRLLIVSTDISKERAAQAAEESLRAQLYRAQRMESLGLLAGGIAHDFNNLLQVIQSNLHFATESSERGVSPAEELSQALRAAERAAELTARLLTVGRKQRVEPRHVEMTDFVTSSVRMLRRTIPAGIELRTQLMPGPLYVSADPAQLEQVLLNLYVNARDAMPTGGKLTISLGTDGPSQERVRLEVADDGCGMDAETAARIFEPFFSTKGTGSGLGLAVAESIVAAHSGSIRVESTPGRGSVFSVSLPRVESTAASQALPGRASHAGHGELILVAEDEAQVRAQLARLLEGAGYRVLLAEDGPRAVELFSERRADVALLVLDVVMPGLDGWQVYQRVRSMCERVGVLFTTGYAANALPDDFGGGGGERLLSKPYRPQLLLEAVAELLAARRSEPHA